MSTVYNENKTGFLIKHFKFVIFLLVLIMLYKEWTKFNIYEINYRC